MAKRALDLLIAIPALILVSPLIAVCGLAIKVADRGPVFYRQRRVGQDGVLFDLWKLRTMVPGAEGIGPGLALDEGDPRITHLGSFLRRTSLDELPNLLNVIRGELSLVGPRPTVERQVLRYNPMQRRRLEVKPGITGWAQLHGRASLPWSRRIELDVWYVDNRSLALDLKILARTPLALVRGGGVYKGKTGGWDLG